MLSVQQHKPLQAVGSRPPPETVLLTGPSLARGQMLRSSPYKGEREQKQGS